MKKVVGIMCIFSLLSLMTNAGAALIADYQFVDNASIPNSSDTELNTSAGSFSAGTGVVMPGATSAIAVSNRSLYVENAATFYALDYAGAESANDYFYFSVAVDSGYDVSYSSLSFATLRLPTTGQGAPRAYSLRVYDGADWSVVGSGSVAVAVDDSSTTFEMNTVDLSSVASLQSNTNAVTFRLYFYDRDASAAAANRVFRIDDVQVHGTVSVIPEPATIGMLVAGAIMALLIRRSR